MLYVYPSNINNNIARIISPPQHKHQHQRQSIAFETYKNKSEKYRKKTFFFLSQNDYFLKVSLIMGHDVILLIERYARGLLKHFRS